MPRPRLDRPTFTLVKRGATYYVRWWWDGQHHRVSTGTSDRGEAARSLAAIDASWGSPAPPPQLTIGAILDGYLTDRRGHVASYASLEAACKALRRHLGDLLPAYMTKEHSRLYARRRRAEGHQVGPKDTRRQKPTSDGTIIHELVTLRAALRWAIGQKWLDSEPAIETPRAPPPRDRWLTREEADRLLAAAVRPHIRLFIALALYTAGRRQALLSLRWSAVDLDRGMVDLGHGVGNKRRAVVPLADELRPLLLEAQAGATTAFVIESGGQPVADVKTGFRAAVRRAGLVGVTPHILRHTAATWMAIGGVPLDEIAMFLGDNQATVERVYRKHSPDYLRRAVRALGPAA